MSRAQGIFRTGNVGRNLWQQGLFYSVTLSIQTSSSHCLFYCPTLWGAFYCLCSHPILLKLTFFLSLFIGPCQTLPGFGKWAGISRSLVLAVGKVIKGGMKRGEGPVQRWGQHFSNLSERDFSPSGVLHDLRDAWQRGTASLPHIHSISVLGDGAGVLCK